MKKKRIGIYVVVTIAICILVAMLLRHNEEKQDEQIQNTIHNKIIEDNFSEETVVEEQIAENVDIQVTEVQDESVSVEVEAPNIAEDLYKWVDSMETEDITDEILETKILELINDTPTKKVTYDLTYFESDELVIEYSDECKNHMTCGMIEFYDMCMENVIKDMKEGK